MGFWYFLALGVNLAVGIAIGWYLCRSLRPAGAEPRPMTENETAEMLDDVRERAAAYNRDLKTLGDELAEKTSLVSIRAHLEDFHQRNSAYRHQLQDGVSRLSQVASLGDEVLRQLLFELVKHTGDISRFGKLVQDQLGSELPSEIQTALNTAIGQLLQSNRRFEVELAAARNELEHHRKELSEARREARIDALTKVANRRGFDEQLVAAHSRLVRNQEGYAIAIFDIDHFKQINDTYGHAAGDSVLEVLAHLLANSIRPYDTAGRLGGDEFALILPRAKAAEARLVADRCRQKVEGTLVRVGEKSLEFRVSIGVAVAREDETTDGVLGRADAALYLAKEDGRNTLRVAEPEPRDVPNSQDAVENNDAEADTESVPQSAKPSSVSVG